MVDIKDGDRSGTRVDILELSNSVCVVNSPVTSASQKTATGSCIECFGFYCLLTNFHVIPSFEIAQKTLCYFGFASGTASFRVRLNPTLIFWASPQEKLDCVIVALSVQTNLPSYIRPFIPDRRPVSVGDYVQVWGHPNIEGRPFQQSSGVVAKLSCSTVHYRADTLDGFSGSPVTSIESGRLVALHCGGPSRNHPQAGNTGTSIHAIIDTFNLEFNVFTIMSNTHAALMASTMSPSPSSSDLLALQQHVHRDMAISAARSNNTRGVVESTPSADFLSSVVPSYVIPVAANVSAASVSESRTVGYAVASVLEAPTSPTSPSREYFLSGENCASWTELATTTAVGLVPIVGPLCNSVFHLNKGQYVSAVVDMLCAGVDLCTIVFATQSSAHGENNANTVVVLRQSVTLGDLCAKNLLVYGRKLLVTTGEQSVAKQLVRSTSESMLKASAKRCILNSALVKTTTSALASATNVYDRQTTTILTPPSDSAIPEEEDEEREDDDYLAPDERETSLRSEVWAQ